jgi:hypothetical protein
MAQDGVFRSIDMMDDEDMLERLVEEAAGIVAAANGKVKISHAMGLVGLKGDDEKHHRTLYQQVRHKSTKVAVAEMGRNSGGLEVVTVGTAAGSLSSLTAGGLQSSFEFSSPSLGTHSTGKRMPSSGSSADSSKSSDKKPAAKVFRRMSKEIHRANAKIAHQLTKRDRQAMKMATVLIERSRVLPKNHPDKRSMATIVDETKMKG